MALVLADMRWHSIPTMLVFGKLVPQYRTVALHGSVCICASTFMTNKVCPHGTRCRYRHAKLETTEVLRIATTKDVQIVFLLS